MNDKNDVSGRGVVAFQSSQHELTLISGPDWDRQAIEFIDVLNEQTYCFNAVRWGADRIECLALKQHGVIVAGAVVILFRMPFTNKGLGILKWGPVWRKRDTQDDPELLRAALTALKSHYAGDRGYFLTVMPPADPGYENIWTGTLQDLGFTPGRKPLAHPNRYFVNLSETVEEQHKNLHHKWRYNLKKAKKNKLDIRVSDSSDGLTAFMSLYRQMLARKKFSDYSMIQALPTMLATDIGVLQPKILLAYYNEKPTAGAVVHTHGDRAVYLFGASDDRALSLKAGYVLHWWIAAWLRETSNARWYDLGGTDGDHGLHQFKKGFVGRQGRIAPIPWDYDCCESALSLCIGKSIYALRKTQKIAHLVRDRVMKLMS